MKKIVWATILCTLMSTSYASAHAQQSAVPAPTKSTLAPAPLKPTVAPMPPLLELPTPMLYVIGQGDKYGYINKQGKVVVEKKYDQAGEFSDGLACVARPINGKLSYGFINSDGKEVIPLQYDYAADFHEGLALVKVNNQLGYINKQGRMVIQPAYHNAASFAEGLAWVVTESDNGWLTYSYINHSGQPLISSPLFNSVEDFHQGVAKVELANPLLNRAAYIDRDGKVIWKQNLQDVATYTQEDVTKLAQSFQLPKQTDDVMKKLQDLEAKALMLEQANPNVKVLLNQFDTSTYFMQLGFTPEQSQQAKAKAFASDVSILLYEKPIRGVGAVAASAQETVGTYKARLFYLLDSTGNPETFLFDTNFHLTNAGEEEAAEPTADEQQKAAIQAKLYDFLYDSYGAQVKQLLRLPADDNWTWKYQNGTLLLEQGDGCGASAQTYRFIPSVIPAELK